MSNGFISSRNEPTANIEIRLRTPICFMAWTSARYGTSDGINRCPLPWRARNATGTPATYTEACRKARQGGARRVLLKAAAADYADNRLLLGGAFLLIDLRGIVVAGGLFLTVLWSIGV
jgi:hypothetical protein